jgi:glycosyltransferase involved in cell wall biosynthesis
MNEKETPKVSIVIPVYNGSNYLREAIDSALAQTYGNCEVLVVNDGSDDGGQTEAIALSYGEKLRYFKKENGGVASALNLGIREMTGEYFSWLSHDDVYYPQKVEKEIGAVLASGDATRLVQCEYDFYDETTGTYTPTDFSRYYTTEQLTDSVFSILQLQIHACSALIHRSQFERVGVFDETRPYTQDIELWFRLFRGQRSLWVGESLYKVRVHPESTSKHYYDAWNKENVSLYMQIMDQMDNRELAEIYGTAENALCRIIGLIKSRNGIKEAAVLEKRLQKCYEKSDNREAVRQFQNYLKAFCGGAEKKIVLFGAGQYGQRLLYELQNRQITVDGLMDNSAEKNGQEIFGLRCHRVDFFVPQKEDYLIMITQRSYEDALQQLKALQFPYVITRQEIDGKLLLYSPQKIERGGNHEVEKQGA